jgi:hypothetical protein
MITHVKEFMQRLMRTYLLEYLPLIKFKQALILLTGLLLGIYLLLGNLEIP